ncbi:MAG TPA: PEP-CTERM sorting domain-containing protein [Myxococcota bacterium]
MSASRILARFSLRTAVVGLAAAATPAAAATIELSNAIAVDPVVIIGGSTNLQATVKNIGASGEGDLNYDISFATPGGPVTASDTLAPGGSETWQAPYDSTGQPFGLNLTTVSVTDPAASNSPRSTQIGVTVLAHSRAFLSKEFGPLMELAQEPSVDPLAFGATGGGESFAATAFSIVNDPPVPTAGLDLDSFFGVGDSQITTDLTTFSNLAYDDDPLNGHLFNILVNVAEPGSFTKTFHLYFSDQDLPGATGPGTVATSFTVIANVVPEPGTASLLALGLAGLAAAARGRRRNFPTRDASIP